MSPNRNLGEKLSRRMEQHIDRALRSEMTCCVLGAARKPTGLRRVVVDDLSVR